MNISQEARIKSQIRETLYRLRTVTNEKDREKWFSFLVKGLLDSFGKDALQYIHNEITNTLNTKEDDDEDQMPNI